MILKTIQLLLACLTFWVGFSCSPKEMIPATNYAGLKVTTRNDWGSVQNNEALPEHAINKITLHHGGVEFTVEQNVIEYLRNLQKWSRNEKGWMDIPYHYIIDLDGNIYEARDVRFPGDTNTTYNPEGHLLICIIGNYEIQKLNDKQYESLTDLLAYFCKIYKLNPDDIKGHKDFADTACPGKNFYPLISSGEIQQAVKIKLDQLIK